MAAILVLLVCCLLVLSLAAAARSACGGRLVVGPKMMGVVLVLVKVLLELASVATARRGIATGKIGPTVANYCSMMVVMVVVVVVLLNLVLLLVVMLLLVVVAMLVLVVVGPIRLARCVFGRRASAIARCVRVGWRGARWGQAQAGRLLEVLVVRWWIDTGNCIHISYRTVKTLVALDLLSGRVG